MDRLAGFADPWEHLRLLSDPNRNAALIELLAHRAPGARVLEVGCGTGLLSLVAARMGAARVFAVEPTPLAGLARQLVADNGLADVVEVLVGRIEDLEPRPVDLAFSELLNADPFFEGPVPAMRAAARWTGDHGLLAPSRLRVWVALVMASSSAREARLAHREIDAVAGRYDLDLRRLSAALSDVGSYRYVSSTERVVSTAALAWDVRLGVDEPAPVVEVEVDVLEPTPAAGAILWFEAELPDDACMSNAPGEGGHWGQLICAWPDERGYRAGERVRLRLTYADHRVDVCR